jgi:hypothetical protein
MLLIVATSEALSAINLVRRSLHHRAASVVAMIDFGFRLSRCLLDEDGQFECT